MELQHLALLAKCHQVLVLLVFLAGGLNADNVKQAIDAVQPYGVDICSGVRTDGKLDERKLEAFAKAVNG